jgi:hypothetical protein
MKVLSTWEVVELEKKLSSALEHDPTVPLLSSGKQKICTQWWIGRAVGVLMAFVLGKDPEGQFLCGPARFLRD